MVRIRRYIGLGLLLLALECPAQEFDAFARVKVSPRDLVVRQPFRVTISVYTATWYTEPLQFTNLKIENAFTVPFTRTLSSIEYIQRKKYATLTFYYLVIPYETGTLEFPSLEIVATTPPVGDYKGVPLTLNTRAQRMQVRDLPGDEEQPWMVAKNVTYRESWDKSLDHLKVGDVLERTLMLNASGTLPSLIQSLDIQKPAGISLYPAPPELQDTRTAQDVNGRRTERYAYLFEEEGEVQIPEVLISWWNPEDRRVYRRTIPAYNLEIAPNPDLDLMISLKDSLDALQAPALSLEEEEAFPWKKYGLILLGCLVLLYLLVRVLLAFLTWARIRRRSYLASTRYYLNCCRRALRKGDANAFVNGLYTWVDRSRSTGQSAAVCRYLSEEDRKNFVHFMESLMADEPVSPAPDWKHQMPSLIKALEKAYDP